MRSSTLKIMEIRSLDWIRIWTAGHLPTSFPGPKAWKDPMADYFGWLA